MTATDFTRKLQADLNRLGAAPQLVEDGILGGMTRRAIIQFQSVAGLVPDGIPGLKTQAAIAHRLTRPTTKPEKNRVRIILVRGKLGDVPFGFSLGMDDLARKLNAIPGVVATVENYGLFYSMSDDIAVALQGALDGGYTHVGCIGHSMGGDTVLKVAWLMLAAGYGMNLAVPVDPTPFGCPAVPRNVATAIGYYNTLPLQLGGWRIRAESDFRGHIETHALAMPHVATDDFTGVHDRCVSAAKALLAA